MNDYLYSEVNLQRYLLTKKKGLLQGSLPRINLKSLF